MTSFHLSLPVPAVDEEVAFLERLRARVTHRDPSGYVNLEWFGAQITLATGDLAAADFHFGVNVDEETFEELARVAGGRVKTVDAGTAIERRKFYVRSPAGYLVEVKCLG